MIYLQIIRSYYKRNHNENEQKIYLCEKQDGKPKKKIWKNNEAK